MISQVLHYNNMDLKPSQWLCVSVLFTTMTAIRLFCLEECHPVV